MRGRRTALAGVEAQEMPSVLGIRAVSAGAVVAAPVAIILMLHRVQRQTPAVGAAEAGVARSAVAAVAALVLLSLRTPQRRIVAMRGHTAPVAHARSAGPAITAPRAHFVLHAQQALTQPRFPRQHAQHALGATSAGQRVCRHRVATERAAREPIVRLGPRHLLIVLQAHTQMRARLPSIIARRVLLPRVGTVLRDLPPPRHLAPRARRAATASVEAVRLRRVPLPATGAPRRLRRRPRACAPRGTMALLLPRRLQPATPAQACARALPEGTAPPHQLLPRASRARRAGTPAYSQRRRACRVPRGDSALKRALKTSACAFVAHMVKQHPHLDL